MKLTLIVAAAVGVIGVLTMAVFAVPMTDDYPGAYPPGCHP
jgi:hypothetical protein